MPSSLITQKRNWLTPKARILRVFSLLGIPYLFLHEQDDDFDY